MAEDLRIKLSASIDTKEVEKAAASLPGQIEREARRRKAGFGDFSKGYYAPDPRTGEIRKVQANYDLPGPGSGAEIKKRLAIEQFRENLAQQQELERKAAEQKAREEQRASDAELRIRYRQFEAKKRAEERAAVEAQRELEKKQREERQAARESTREAEKQRREQERAAREATRIAEQQKREQERIAREAARAAAQQAREQQRQAEAAARQAAQVAAQAQRQAQQQATQAARQAAQAQRQAQQQATQAARQAAQAQRQAAQQAAAAQRQAAAAARAAQRQAAAAARQAQQDDWGEKFSKQFSAGMLRAIGPWYLAVKTFEYVLDKVKEKIQNLSNLYDTQQVVGFDAIKMQRMAFAFGQTGMKEDTFTSSMGAAQMKLNRGLMGMDQGAIMAITQLGFSMEDVRNGSVDAIDILLELADQLKANGQDARLVTIGMGLFGNEFESMLPLLQNGRQAIEAFGNKAPVISQTALQLVRDVENVKRQVDATIGTGLVGAALSGNEASAAYKTAEKFDQILTAARGDEKKAIKDAFKLESEGGLRNFGESIDSFSRRLREALEYSTTNPSQPRAQRSGNTVYWVDQYLSQQVRGFLNTYNQKVSGVMKELQPRQFMASGGYLPIASSLQQMGGGDAYSAINRGPMDDIASNTAQTAANTAILANRQTSPTTTPTPATLGP